MIRIVYLLVKPESMSDEVFKRECIIHFDMSQGMPGLHKYEVRLVSGNPSDTHVPYLDVGPVHAIGECWFLDEANYQVYLQADQRKAWFEHGKSFIGQLKPFVTEELV
ncbi:4-methylmuconolactone methylisomerase [Pseudomonas capeferrum]|uniref:4-methylmuconolactone methylisomerase n=1 Tax=Pseudomonas capeferrum TaxID=1495066 RepID=UPI0015E33A7E|nr:4-methylmuconolactone methylisomerase [Pseudomonas capeferrum]MBA1204801.1 4-methylmuconolactone methylisomerase [Pseudomonas capeferrum]